MKRRFKTEAEFRAESNWPPAGWVREMHSLAGQEIDETKLRDKGNGNINYLSPNGYGDMVDWLMNMSDVTNASITTNNNFIIHPVNEFKF